MIKTMEVVLRSNERSTVSRREILGTFPRLFTTGGSSTFSLLDFGFFTETLTLHFSSIMRTPLQFGILGMRTL